MKNSTSISIGISGILVISLAVIKAAGADISWGWVFAPVWLPVAAAIFLIAAIMVIVSIFLGLAIILIALMEYCE